VSIIKKVVKNTIHNSIEIFGYSHRNRQRLKGQLIILTYHSFCKTLHQGLFASLPIEQFEQQLRYLKKYFTLVSVSEGIKRISSIDTETDKPMVAITIDDGFEDNYHFAYPLLQKYQIPGTIFLATDFIDNNRSPWPTQILNIFEQTNLSKLEFPFFLDISSLNKKSIAVQKIKYQWANLSPEDRFKYIQELKTHLKVSNDGNYKPLNWHQIRDMNINGIEFGSHTVFHSVLSSVGSEIILQELSQSKSKIEEKIQKTCDLFAYPDGGFSKETKKFVQNAGYNVALTQKNGVNTKSTDLMEMRRVEIPYYEKLNSFRCRSSMTAPDINKIKNRLKLF
jgi:peptidoglycan/xylan/chitin deacetylase (PgdA/CDA1 family)